VSEKKKYPASAQLLSRARKALGIPNKGHEITKLKPVAAVAANALGQSEPSGRRDCWRVIHEYTQTLPQQEYQQFKADLLSHDMQTFRSAKAAFESGLRSEIQCPRCGKYMVRIAQRWRCKECGWSDGVDAVLSKFQARTGKLAAKAFDAMRPETWSHDFIAGAEFLRTFVWKRLRMEVLAERGNRCECCGARPSAENAVVINVDHIKPRKLYPTLALDKRNLQILCGECNHGKGNWNQTDWRDDVALSHQQLQRADAAGASENADRCEQV
jgi:ribosomal protein L37AE/L43A